MAEPFLGEIKIFGFDWAPVNWAKCDGQILPVNQNQSLYALLGTNFGGDGRTSFALPDMRSRTPVHLGASRFDAEGFNVVMGQRNGFETVTLSEANLPVHTHGVKATDETADVKNPGGAAFATSTNRGEIGGDVYRSPTNLVDLDEKTVSYAGAGQASNNMQPSTVTNFCIALKGVFPSKN